MNEKKLVSGLVSIAIPAYKKKWLKEAIVSALSQDYPNIEVIIVDDHSPQNLREVVVLSLLIKECHTTIMKSILGVRVSLIIGINALNM